MDSSSGQPCGNESLLKIALPRPLLLAAAWSFCVLLIAGAAWLLGKVLGSLTPAIAPLAVAVLLAALLRPVVEVLHRKLRLPHPLASLVTVLGLIGAVGAGIALVATQVAAGIPELRDRTQSGIDSLLQSLADGPLHLTSDALANLVNQIRGAISEHSSSLANGALEVGSSAIDAVAGTFICLIALYFFLDHGERIWAFLIGLLPKDAREPVYQASRRGWISLSAYTRMQLAVATINAAGIGLGAAFLGVPFVIPITVLTFLASFVPIVGSLISGAFAVLIAFIDKGVWMALIMLAIVVGVHLLEAHGLQPFLMGHAVALHPLAVIVVVAAGTYLYGLVGALFAVPVTALLNSVIRYLAGHDPFPVLAPIAENSDDAESG